MTKHTLTLLLITLFACHISAQSRIYNTPPPFDGMKGKVKQVTIYTYETTLENGEYVNVHKREPSKTSIKEYDLTGQLVREIGYEPSGKEVYTHTISYNEKGTILTQTGRKEDEQRIYTKKLINDGANKKIWLTTYNTDKQKVDSTILYLKYATRTDSLIDMQYDRPSVTHYNGRGLITQQSNNGPDMTHYTTYSYDKEQRLSGSIRYFKNHPLAASNMKVKYLASDAQGNWTLSAAHSLSIIVYMTKREIEYYK